MNGGTPAPGATVTTQLLQRLERHYLKPGKTLPGGLFVPECGWNGVGKATRCDALYIGFTAASGRLLVGHELKTSRSDWRAELDKPGKADPWHDECHAWYVVAPSTQVVPPTELPNGWGLMVPNPRSKVRFDIVQPAAVHHDRNPSWDAVRSIMARQDTLRGSALEQMRRDADRAARERLRAEQESLRQTGVLVYLDAATRERLRGLDRLEAALGVTVTAWLDSDTSLSPEAAARLLHVVRDERALLAHGHTSHLLDQAEAAAQDLAGVIQTYRAAARALRLATDPEHSERVS